MIKDSGERRRFLDPKTGEEAAVRDMSSGKGRFDLIPMRELFLATEDEFFNYIANFVETGDPEELIYAAKEVFHNIGSNHDRDAYSALLSLAVHQEKGMEKYGLDNWKKGIPLSSYVDSACRHYCKWTAGWQDEDHLSACLFNLLCGAWTARNKPEFNAYREVRE